MSCLIAELDTMIELLNCDCMEYMATVPDKYFDLAIVDPPYGIGWMEQVKNPNKGKNWKQYVNKDWDNSAPQPNYFDELQRVSKNQIIWGANHFIDSMPLANLSLMPLKTGLLML